MMATYDEYGNLVTAAATTAAAGAGATNHIAKKLSGGVKPFARDVVGATVDLGGSARDTLRGRASEMAAGYQRRKAGNDFNRQAEIEHRRLTTQEELQQNRRIRESNAADRWHGTRSNMSPERRQRMLDNQANYDAELNRVMRERFGRVSPTRVQGRDFADAPTGQDAGSSARWNESPDVSGTDAQTRARAMAAGTLGEDTNVRGAPRNSAAQQGRIDSLNLQIKGNASEMQRLQELIGSTSIPKEQKVGAKQRLAELRSSDKALHKEIAGIRVNPDTGNAYGSQADRVKSATGTIRESVGNASRKAGEKVSEFIEGVSRARSGAAPTGGFRENVSGAAEAVGETIRDVRDGVQRGYTGDSTVSASAEPEVDPSAEPESEPKSKSKSEPEPNRVRNTLRGTSLGASPLVALMLGDQINQSIGSSTADVGAGEEIMTPFEAIGKVYHDVLGVDASTGEGGLDYVVNPVSNTIRGLWESAMHPIDTLKGMGESIYRGGEAAVNGIGRLFDGGTDAPVSAPAGGQSTATTPARNESGNVEARNITMPDGSVRRVITQKDLTDEQVIALMDNPLSVYGGAATNRSNPGGSRSSGGPRTMREALNGQSYFGDNLFGPQFGPGNPFQASLRNNVATGNLRLAAADAGLQNARDKAVLDSTTELLKQGLTNRENSRKGLREDITLLRDEDAGGAYNNALMAEAIKDPYGDAALPIRAELAKKLYVKSGGNGFLNSFNPTTERGLYDYFASPEVAENTSGIFGNLRVRPDGMVVQMTPDGETDVVEMSALSPGEKNALKAFIDADRRR